MTDKGASDLLRRKLPSVRVVTSDGGRIGDEFLERSRAIIADSSTVHWGTLAEIRMAGAWILDSLPTELQEAWAHLSAESPTTIIQILGAREIDPVLVPPLVPYPPPDSEPFDHYVECLSEATSKTAAISVAQRAIDALSNDEGLLRVKRGEGPAPELLGEKVHSLVNATCEPKADRDHSTIVELAFGLLREAHRWVGQANTQGTQAILKLLFNELGRALVPVAIDGADLLPDPIAAWLDRVLLERAAVLVEVATQCNDEPLGMRLVSKFESCIYPSMLADVLDLPDDVGSAWDCHMTWAASVCLAARVEDREYPDDPWGEALVKVSGVRTGWGINTTPFDHDAARGAWLVWVAANACVRLREQGNSAWERLRADVVTHASQMRVEWMWHSTSTSPAWLSLPHFILELAMLEPPLPLAATLAPYVALIRDPKITGRMLESLRDVDDGTEQKAKAMLLERHTRLVDHCAAMGR